MCVGAPMLLGQRSANPLNSPKKFFGQCSKKHTLLFVNSHLKPMEQSMSDCDVPSGTSNLQTSTLHVDDLLCDHEVRSGWKVVATTNLLTMCHTGTCTPCSSSLEHLLIANRMGEMCACPADLPKMLDCTWPATMGNIHEDVASPLLGEIENVNHVITDREDEIAHLWGKVNHLCAERNEETSCRQRVEEWLSRFKGKQRDTPLT